VEVRIYAEMQPQRASTEPRAAARGKVWWLHFFSQSKNSTVERARDRFLPLGHRQLYVVEANDLIHDSIQVPE
jgi:hypothetical protein